MPDDTDPIQTARQIASKASANYRAAAPELLALMIGAQLTGKVLDAVPVPWSWLVFFPWAAWVLYSASPRRAARKEAAEMGKLGRYTDEHGDDPRREYR